jgi:hypothetical protein
VTIGAPFHLEQINPVTLLCRLGCIQLMRTFAEMRQRLPFCTRTLRQSCRRPSESPDKSVAWRGFARGATNL